MPEFRRGVELARDFYREAVRPLLDDRPHLAARIGPGSDVLGFDTARSTDHDWGPRLQLFLDDPGDLDQRLREGLPKRFRGWPTHFVPPGARVRSMADTDGPVDHYIDILPLETWLRHRLGADPQWLSLPWQRLAEVAGGAVFHDPGGELAAVRATWKWYPDDLLRHVLGCQWARIGQEEAFVGRTAEIGDDPGSRMVTARLARDVARLLLLQQRRWPPYQKWLSAACPDPRLAAALAADDAKTRSDALADAYEEAARRQNALGLCPPLDTRRRPYFDRGYPVIDAGRFAEALLDGRPAIGSIDQICDSTGVLERPDICRAVCSAAHSPRQEG
ncbi:hypothetical protein ACWT_4084 [Actinoplanes sp. SE50]|uniref:DUF4037 domain-containing protein n=1 Tax=unclassified Actinoplanes TaxID=2626549 RepID=UPI00023EBD6E|nr:MULTISPECIES: DUF4037 domain-containing protein [unclassified Actinoplanes]AEV85108.1 hypothetical protein ACPL_4213 [Actinoplanes sp. SE50/110]ATO83499.1 hypothetical protein ACWT_4084 [Actinoplanes sp. SE50]SLM00906.1 hypothetical protein ACSP50_4139 [Actinoplanes sp. SE50/110]